jgi:hypothetical protein
MFYSLPPNGPPLTPRHAVEAASYPRKALIAIKRESLLITCLTTLFTGACSGAFLAMIEALPTEVVD